MGASREEQIEPIEVDLLLVDFHLCEVGVVGRVEREARRQAVLHIDTGLAAQPRVRAARIVDRLPECVGGDLQIPLWRHLELQQRPGERQPGNVELARQRGPVRRLVVTTDAPFEIEPPRLYVAIGVAKRAKGDLELGAPALGMHTCLHAPRAVPVQIEPAAGSALLPRESAAPLAFVHDLGVVFEPGGVGAEHEPRLAVAIGVEDEAKAVGVVERRITPRVGHDDPGGVAVEADDAHIERGACIDDADFSALAGRISLARILLHEPAWRGCDVAPGFVVQDIAVQHWRCACLHGAGGRPLNRRKRGLCRTGESRGDEEQQTGSRDDRGAWRHQTTTRRGCRSELAMLA